MDVSLSKLQEIVKDREAWGAAVREVTKSRTPLSNQRATTKYKRIKISILKKYLHFHIHCSLICNSKTR